MPGLAEELVYRGILPALLLWRIAKAGDPEGMPWAVILATAVAFGVWHGLQFSGGHFGFDVMSALFPFLGSIPGGWLRFKTRSLVFPIAAHSLANVAFHIAGGIHG
jgi:membrane protease YdiL (CAAX protease family)